MITINIKRKAFHDEVILKDVHLSIENGESVALLGASGIGKTTLLRIIAGLDQNYDGSCQVSDKISYVFQEPTLLDWRTALENITLITGVSDEKAHQNLNELGLKDKANHYPNQLSLGQRRRLALARAFAVEPEFLIMDEPFTSLDDALNQEMLELTKALIEAKRMSMLFVTHSEREAGFLSTRILRLSGRPATIE